MSSSSLSILLQISHLLLLMYYVDACLPLTNIRPIAVLASVFFLSSSFCFSFLILWNRGVGLAQRASVLVTRSIFSYYYQLKEAKTLQILDCYVYKSNKQMKTDFFMTAPDKVRRPVSTYQPKSRSMHRQQSVKFIKQPPFLHKTPIKQKSVAKQTLQEMASRELQRSIQNLKDRKTAKTEWKKIVDLFQIFIEISDEDNSATQSATVTPGTNNDQCSSIIQRTTQKTRTHNLRKNSSSYCLTPENQNQSTKKSFNSNLQQRKVKLQGSLKDRSKEKRQIKDKPCFLKKDKRSFEQQIERIQEKTAKSKRASQNILQQTNNIIKQSLLENSSNGQNSPKQEEVEQTKKFSKYQLRKMQQQEEIRKAKEQKQNEKRQKLIEEQKILNSVHLFQCLLKADLSKKYRFNIPETIMLDDDRVMQLLSTQNGVITKRNVRKTDAYRIMQKGHETTLNMMKGGNNQAIYTKMYDSLIDPKLNEKAPFVVIANEKGEPKHRNNLNVKIQVENAKHFNENGWNSNESSYLQRFIYSRNLKAMIMRVVYQKPQRGQQIQQYYINRFQNYASIFGENSGFHDLKAKVSPSYSRQLTLQYSKLTGKLLVNHFIEPTAQIKKVIESIQKKNVQRLWVDFIEDITGTIWAVGVKAVVFEAVESIRMSQLWLISEQVGTCRLCNGVFQKRHLQNSVSVRMLLQFLNHLRRRTRLQDLHSFQFVNFSSLNKKEHAMSAVCQCCYELIIRELQLKKYQRELGRICNIQMDDEGDPQKVQGKELRQWRLMIYLDEITEQPKESSDLKMQNLAIRYALSKGIEQKWKCKIQKQLISIKRVKVHYFFSQSSNIEDFLKNTQILVSVLSGDKQQNEKVIAQGSTGILANFRNKCATENGQRQTSTVLLFFQSRKYCALTLKVGLVYDGVYKLPEIPLIKVHSVMFPAKNWLNSNPLPKEWMEAFGYGEEINLAEVKYEDLLKNKSQNKKSTLTKKKIKNFF